MKCPEFKTLLFIFFLILGSQVHAQKFKEFWTKSYNSVFPNNKSIRLQKIQAENDSLKQLNDSLNGAQSYAIDKINYLKKEVTNVKTELYHVQLKQKDSLLLMEQKISSLRDSIKLLSFPIVTCKEEVIQRPGLSDPELINTCRWRHYETIENGVPDAKGRYSWSTLITDLNDDTGRGVANASLFIENKIPELEQKINERLAEDFKALMESEPNCFKKKKEYTNYSLKDMRISISDASEITFEVIYGLPDECFAVNAASTSFKIAELRAFFSE
jgi:hypothetical protein